MTERPRILHIEDSRSSRMLVEHLLSRHYDIESAGTAFEGLALAREHRPTLVIMDIDLPDLDGRELATRMRTIPGLRETPIVALTGSNTPGNRELALAAGCVGFLTKPLDPTGFHDQIQAFLDGRVEELTRDQRSVHLEIHAQRLVERLETKIHELERANTRLAELDRLKSDFIVMVSHELRSPLTLITGYADLLTESLDEPLTHESVATIGNGLAEGVARMQEVVNEIIRISGISSGTMPLELGPVDLDEMIELIVDEMRPVCVARSTAMVLEGLAELPKVRADEKRLREALANVIGNAIKFTPDQGTVRILGARAPGLARIVIADSGIGIAPAEQQRIFDPFYVLGSQLKHHSTSKTKFQGGGLGLGLAIAKGIVEAHGGTIAVESDRRDPDAPPGSTFTIELPESPHP